MTIEHGFVYALKEELFLGTHDFSNDVFKLALFTSSANLTLSGTTAYSTSNEASGSGYAAGGLTLTVPSGFPKMNDTAFGGIPIGQMLLMDFEDATFYAAVTARAALLYNSSKSNKAICIIDFGQDMISTTALAFQFPAPNTVNAFIRVN